MGRNTELSVVVVMVMLLPCIHGVVNCQKKLSTCRASLASVKSELEQCKNPGGPESCPMSFTYNAEFGSCYNFVTRQKVGWFDALTFCDAMGANLVAIETKEEFDFIRAEIKQKGLKWPGGVSDSFFTGGTAINGDWQWMGGASFDTKAMSYAPWEPGQGSGDQYRSGQICHILWSPDYYKWHDFGCTSVHNFICEIKFDEVDDV